jgi:AcrR family transcriptional regulator
MDVALEVLASDGLAAISIRRVCKQANLSPRYFYESFTNVDQLLDSVIERVTADAMDRVAAVAGSRSSTTSLTGLARQGVEVMVAVYADDPGPLQILRVGDAATKARRDNVAEQTLVQMRGYLNAAVGEGADATLIDVAAHLLFSGWLGTLSAYTDGELDISRDELVDRLAHLLVGVVRSIRDDGTKPAR